MFQLFGFEVQVPYLLLGVWFSASLFWGRRMMMSIHAAFMLAVCTAMGMYIAEFSWWKQLLMAFYMAGLPLIWWVFGGRVYPRVGGWLMLIGGFGQLLDTIIVPNTHFLPRAATFLVMCILGVAFAMPEFWASITQKNATK
jgi:hypothetical protein